MSLSEYLGEFYNIGFGILAFVVVAISTLAFNEIKKARGVSKEAVKEWAFHYFLTAIVTACILWGLYISAFDDKVSFPFKALVMVFSIFMTAKSLEVKKKSKLIFTYRILLAVYAIFIAISACNEDLFKYVNTFDDFFAGAVVLLTSWIFLLKGKEDTLCENCKRQTGTTT
ncbi:TPA: hypothetical protein QCR33_003564 [Bacillus cereus]|nr:hypothetical protein [Bacillus cereus]HDR4610419.1 hypothetical protein [Bacillus cereus]HDR4627920.1 hypothetical protein [Bacillus cereus]HDR4662515.1 hypothetical protein [Bacillus cereus]HDR4929619.1 hypothetical protein [Bacillus cereus]